MLYLRAVLKLECYDFLSMVCPPPVEMILGGGFDGAKSSTHFFRGIKIVAFFETDTSADKTAPLCFL